MAVNLPGKAELLAAQISESILEFHAGCQMCKKVTDPGKSEVCYQCVLCVFNKRRKVYIEILYVTIFNTILEALCEDCVKNV